MKKTMILAFASALALSASALAQSADAPGAAPVGSGGGVNTPGSGAGASKYPNSSGAMKGDRLMNKGLSEGRASTTDQDNGSATDRNNPTNVAPSPKTNTRSGANGG